MLALRVILTDGEERGALAACRGLHAAGFEVTAAASIRPAPAQWSRSCSERLMVPAPLDDEPGFLLAMANAAGGDERPLAMTCSDAALRAVSGGREVLEPRARLALPPGSVVDTSFSKLALGEAARAVGLASPDTAVCAGVVEALEQARRWGFPVVLKGVQSLVWVGGRLIHSGGSRLVSDETSLAELAPLFGEPCLVQRRELGRVVSFAGVRAGGRLLGVCVSRYRRTWLPESGNVCFSETVVAPPALTEVVDRLVEALGWEGIFELELIERADGSFAAIDFNPRVYGSIALAIGAGANLPAIWARWVVEGTAVSATARPGVRYRWEDADLRHFLWQLRAGRPRAALSVLRPHRGVVHPHFRIDDPAPMLARAGLLAGTGTRSLRRERAASTPAEPVPRRAARARGHRVSADRVAVIGAGPYGLAAAAHLRHAGAQVHVLGDVVGFWREHMPEGMLLRSRLRSSHIADPEGRRTIERYEAETGRSVRRPSLRLEEFIEYASWFQRRWVPEVDPRKVERLDQVDGRFRLLLNDGAELDASHVVVAAGLAPFALRPLPFSDLPSSLVLHSSDLRELRRMEGKRILVVGRGQSALESAALLREVGADVELLVRTRDLRWLPAEDAPPRGLRDRLPVPPTDVGGFATGWVAAAPDVYRRLPRGLGGTLSWRCVRPAGSDWLRPRLAGVPIALDVEVSGAARENGHVCVELSDGSARTADHVLLGTGYAVDVRRYSFLAPDLAQSITTVAGYPILGAGFESSVPGLHFVGAPAATSFGPLMRFVVGTWYAAPAVTAGVLGGRRRGTRLSFPRGAPSPRGG